MYSHMYTRMPIHVYMYVCVYFCVSVDVRSHLLVISQKPHTLFVFVQSFTEVGALIRQSWLPLSTRDPQVLTSEWMYMTWVRDQVHLSKPAS